MPHSRNYDLPLTFYFAIGLIVLGYESMGLGPTVLIGVGSAGLVLLVSLVVALVGQWRRGRYSRIGKFSVGLLPPPQTGGAAPVRMR